MKNCLNKRKRGSTATLKGDEINGEENKCE